MPQETFERELQRLQHEVLVLGSMVENALIKVEQPSPQNSPVDRCTGELFVCTRSDSNRDPSQMS